MPTPQSLTEFFDGDIPLFEQKGRRNSYTTWSARYVAECLGYPNFASFRGVISKAQEVLTTLGIDVTEHFSSEPSLDERGRSMKDMRLSRFACYLAAMNGDVKKFQVARAQAYFARFSEECQRFLDDGEPIERLLIRKEVSKHERGLSHTAHEAGVEDYAMFKNAGYRGLYNMDLSELRALKGIPKSRTPLDFMGKDELAANLFRITQTEAKIRGDRVKGQIALEVTAEVVGKKVRQTMHEISGQSPENLPVTEDIRIVRRELKHSGHTLKHGSVNDMKELPAETYPENPDEDED